MNIRRSWIWYTLLIALLCAFSVYVLLDTFVITKVYSTAAAAASAAEPASASQETESSLKELNVKYTEESADGTSDQEISLPSDAAVVGTYSDGDLEITVYTYRVYDTQVYVADVTASSAEALQTALAKNSYGRNVTQTTSDMAESSGAVLAVNGDYYGSREKGYVIRNGVLYRSRSAGDQEDLVIYADGSFEIVNERYVTAEELLNNGAQQVLSFGPGLISGGEITITETTEVDRARTSNPRTAVAQVGDLHYVFVVSDGRSDESEGLTLYQLACVLQDLGVETAYNLDGGGSSTMVFLGEVVNEPTGSGRSTNERKVSDIVYFA